MNQSNSFTVAIAADLPPDERMALILALRSQANVEESQSKSIDWETVMTIIGTRR